ncbi:MAG: acetate--CoA ligase [Candidatus Hadarchaeales archaeon]
MALALPPELQRMIDLGRKNPEKLWGEVAEELHWFEKYKKVFEKEKYPFFKWFVGGTTNISYNCLDRHVERGKGDKPSLIWESAETGENRTFTYRKLLEEVKRFASALRALGVKKGDRVTLYMPMVPEAAVGIFACLRIGAIYSPVFAGFGYHALAERIADADPKVVLTADLAYRRGTTIRLKEILDRALEFPNHVEKVIILKRGEGGAITKPERDLYWEEALKLGKRENAELVPMEANEPAFILYTSGTTAKPKGALHNHGGYQVYVYAMGKWVYGLEEKDIWFCLSDIGWIVGSSYVLFGPLLVGATTLMYEGTPDYPSPDILWKLVEKHRVTKMWVSPTLIRTLMKYGEELPSKYDLSSLKFVASAGEPLNPAAWEWLQKKVLKDRAPVVDHMWQTETGGPIVGNPYGISLLPIKPGSATIPLPGVEGEVVDEKGNPVPPGVEGIFVVKKPFPGLIQTLWRAEGRYVEEYWNRIPPYYYTGDAAKKDEDGYIWFIARTDEVIKISGHRIGAIEVESALLTHPAVAEAAVVGMPDPIRKEVACAFVVLKSGFSPSDALKEEIREKVRNLMGPLVVFGGFFFVNRLPKTRSGKIMRRLLKALLSNQPLGDYSTIEDPAVVDELRNLLQQGR